MRGLVPSFLSNSSNFLKGKFVIFYIVGRVPCEKKGRSEERGEEEGEISAANCGNSTKHTPSFSRLCGSKGLGLAWFCLLHQSTTILRVYSEGALKTIQLAYCLRALYVHCEPF